MTEEKEILKKLVVDKDEIRKNYQQLVEKAMKIFRISGDNGRIIFQDYANLIDQERICAVLIGKYFASELGIISDSSLSPSEISKEVGKPLNTVTSRLTQLSKKGFIEKLSNRKYRIVYPRISEILNDILKSKNKK